MRPRLILSAPRRGPHRARGLLLALATALMPVPAFGAAATTGAAPEPPCTVLVAAADRAALWAPPLDRLVTLRVSDMPLREAVDRLAAVAHVELSYSADLLPADRRVCLALERVPVGAVLDHLLDGSLLRPIVLGTTQVVLAPSRASARSEEVPFSRRSSLLDRVVVTGSPDGAAQRASPYAIDVIDGVQLTQHAVSTLGEALELSVPGMWTWTNTAGSVTARYASIRGASSFGVSAPKIYLDGIEVANPLLVTQIDPSRVARVEVIRGPQGAALYGADAISGVVNILTRHDGTSTGRSQLQMSTMAGVSSTAFAERDPFVQEHSLAFRRGSAARNVGVGFNLGTVGAYVPGASERRLLLDADGRFSRRQSIYTGFTRFSLQRANAGSSLMLGESGLGPLPGQRTPSLSAPLMDARRYAGFLPTLSPNDSTRPRLPGDTLRRVVVADSAGGQEMAQYTVGGSIAVMPNLQWTHTIIAGVDGYRLQGLSPYSLAGPQSLSSAALAGSAAAAADRASLRVRTVGRFDLAPATLLTLTLGVEQAFTHEVMTSVARAMSRQVPSSATYDNTGVSAQLQVAWRDRWFASAGARAERTDGATPNAQQSLLPMLGVAHVREVGNIVLKMRGAFGTGIRPARSLLRSSSWMGQGQFTALSALDPERQSGVEAGADLLFGSRVAVHLTRFDQRATGLIQPVSSVVTAVGSTGRIGRTMAFTLQNVGAITNRGWEVDGTGRAGPVSLAVAFSQVDSRVARLAPGYRGDLQVGDRMLDVPSRSVSLTAAWTRSRWTFTSTAIRAADWIGYDRRAIGAMLSDATESPRTLEGSNLRAYWITYPGVTRWRAGAVYRLRDGLSLTTQGENLLNVQTDAPDNATVIAGRTFTFGVRTTF
jgi:hypothetical protein